ncbi:MAG: M48 family metallopeptidase [Clostridia bacterium]|nr:M48 family metallopeptidase [Clostridia bacterium]
MPMFKLIRSKRKSISVEISPELEVIVRAPRGMKQKDIDRFIDEHREWIKKHIDIRAKRLVNRPPEPDEYEIIDLKRRAKELLPLKVACFSSIMGVEPASVKITSAKKRLGSCSSDNGICFSYRVMMYPEDIIDYVVIHELAHIKEHNHSKRFYDIVRKYCPDYKDREGRIKW